MDIALTFINQSSDKNNSQVVIFQKNAVVPADELAVAWRVIETAPGQSEEIVFPMDNYLSAGNSWQKTAVVQSYAKGDKWVVLPDGNGSMISREGSDAAVAGVEVRNGLASGAVDVHVYKSGKLLAVKTGVVPGRKAAFAFKPTIWIGVVAEVQEGGVMNSAVLSQVDTEFSLAGISKANIVLTGGGVGNTATPYVFTLVPELP